ncbi:MAG: hypothetical protein RBQ97_04460 [Acholeplasma sp.]|nr:hypothetical protein [Acholeplasma sp.]
MDSELWNELCKSKAEMEERFNDIFKNSSIPEKSKRWMQETAIENNIELEKLCKKYIECEQELREMGLRKWSEDPEVGLEDHEYYEFIENQVNSYIVSTVGSRKPSKTKEKQGSLQYCEGYLDGHKHLKSYLTYLIKNNILEPAQANYIVKNIIIDESGKKYRTKTEARDDMQNIIGYFRK